jgi:hypothetical protein
LEATISPCGPSALSAAVTDSTDMLVPSIVAKSLPRTLGLASKHSVLMIVVMSFSLFMGMVFTSVQL